MKRKFKLLTVVLSVLILVSLWENYNIEAKTVKPAKPQINVTSYCGSVEIYVSKTKNADRYQVYMKAPGEKKYKLVNTILDAAAGDFRTTALSGLSTGTYSFKVRGVNGTTKGKFSKVKKVKVSSEFVSTKNRKCYSLVSMTQENSDGKFVTKTANQLDVKSFIILNSDGTGYYSKSYGTESDIIRSIRWKDSKLISIGDRNEYEIVQNGKYLDLNLGTNKASFIETKDTIEIESYDKNIKDAIFNHKMFEDIYVGNLDYDQYDMVLAICEICFADNQLASKMSENHIYKFIISGDGLKMLCDGKKIKKTDVFYKVLEKNGFTKYIDSLSKLSFWQDDYVVEVGADLKIQEINEPITYVKVSLL